MYRHILLPTDGSALSQSAVESGVQLAEKALGAQVTGLHVTAKVAATPLGSETAKVLIQSPIPVLIHRGPAGTPIATRVEPVLR